MLSSDSAGLPQIFSLYKTQYLWNAVSQSAVEGGLSVESWLWQFRKRGARTQGLWLAPLCCLDAPSIVPPSLCSGPSPSTLSSREVRSRAGPRVLGDWGVMLFFREVRGSESPMTLSPGHLGRLTVGISLCPCRCRRSVELHKNPRRAMHVLKSVQWGVKAC